MAKEDISQQFQQTRIPSQQQSFQVIFPSLCARNVIWIKEILLFDRWPPNIKKSNTLIIPETGVGVQNDIDLIQSDPGKTEVKY